MAFKPHRRDAKASPFRQVEAHLADSNVGHLARAIYSETAFDDVEGYSSLRHGDLTGYEDHNAAFFGVRSPEQEQFIKHGIDKSRDNRRTIHNTDSFGLSLLQGIADPLALIPIPFLKGVGFVRGAVRGAGGIGGTVAVSEGIRQFTDPLSTVEEMVPAIAGGAVLGGLLGGLMGRAGAKAMASKDDLWTGMQSAYDDAEAGILDPTSIPKNAGAGPARRARERSDEPEKIVSATLSKDQDGTGQVFSSTTHGEAMMLAEDAGVDASTFFVGFMTTSGRIVGREEARKIAVASKQHVPGGTEGIKETELVGEDILANGGYANAGAGPARGAREGSDYQFDGPGFLNKMKWAEMPFYRLKNILTEHFPNSPLNKIPEMMVGLPGLVTKMNRAGETAGVAATNLARQDAEGLVTAVQLIERGYLKFHGKDGTVANPGRSVLGQKVSNMLNRGDPSRMSVSDFNQQVGRAMVLGGHEVAEIAETAVAVKKYYSEWADKLEADGVLFSEVGVRREIGVRSSAIAKMQPTINNLEALKAAGKASPDQLAQLGRLKARSGHLTAEIESRTRMIETADFSAMRPEDFIPIHYKIARLKSDPTYREGLIKVYEDYYSGQKGRAGGRTVRQRAEDSVKRIVNDEFADPLARRHQEFTSKAAKEYAKVMEISARLRAELGRSPTNREISDLMRGTEKEVEQIIFNAAEESSPTPRELIARKSDIPRSLILDYIETDIDVLTRTYGRRMASVHALNKNFKHYSMFEQIEGIRAEFEIKMANAGAAERKALTKAMNNAIEDVENLRDRMLGTYKMGDADTWTEEAINMVKGVGNLTLMGGAVQVAMIDVALIATTAGFDRAWRSGLMAMMQNPAQFKLAAAEAARAGLIVEKVLHSRIQELTNTAGLHASTGLGRAIQGAQPLVFTLSLFNHFTDAARQVAAGIIVSNMGDTIQAIAKGTVTKAMERDIAQLARGGIGKAEAIAIAKQMDTHGAKVDDVWAVNTQSWVDDVADPGGIPADTLVETFRAALIDAVDNVVLYPGIADTPNFMAKGIFTALLQYRRFGMSATQRIAGSAMQFKDQRAMAGMTAMVAMAYILESTWRAPKFENRDFSEKLFDAVETSGVTGIVLDFNNMFENLTAGEMGLRPMLGMDPRVKNKNWATQLGAVASPAGSTALKLARALTDPDVMPGEPAYALRRSLPLQNLWWAKAGFNSLQDALDSMIEGNGE